MPIVWTNSWEIELNKIDPIRGFHRTNRRNRGEGGLKKGEGEIGGIGKGIRENTSERSIGRKT